MIQIIKPLPSIHASLDIYKYAVPIRFSILILTLVYVSVRVGHSTSAVEEAVLCLAPVDGAIGVF